MQMTLRRFVKEFRSVTQQNIGGKAMQLGKGQCKDFEEYKKVTGFIAGLEAGADLAEQMLRQIEDAEEAQDGLPEMPPMGDGTNG